ncbi:NAD(P)/FAD-dependent oxidoreductase [Streptomyces chartreusis]|uniref:NAD(P)/FAD-dependent oxidoreductase n=1 Tax=Streptomyces chartreusis TaxID=1969 RepID=UPI003D8CCF5D
MSTPRVVIVGAGHAGVQAAGSIRAEGFDGTVVLLDEHHGLPYQRPPLSKDYLKGDDPAQRSLLRPQSFFAKNSIDLRLGQDGQVTGVDRGARTLFLASGASLSYDHLVIATGSRNRRLPVPGGDLPSVHQLRTHDDAVGLHGRLRRASKVAVVGGGFVGLEIAASARTLGAQVTVIESLPRLMARSVTEITAAHLADLHRSQGVELLLSTSVTRITDRGGKTALITGSGDEIEADLVVVGIGAEAVTDVAELAGVPVDNGIVVDEFFRTDDPAIYAIGDCASTPRADGQRTRLESVQSAVEHAKAVARTICGHPPAAREVPWFWSNQHSAKLQIVGLVGARDAEYVLGEPDQGSFNVLCFAQDRFIGGESVNSPKDHLAMRRLLDRGATLTVEELTHPAVDLAAMAGRS